jgi:hypothetical protein
MQNDEPLNCSNQVEFYPLVVRILGNSRDPIPNSRGFYEGAMRSS